MKLKYIIHREDGSETERIFTMEELQLRSNEEWLRNHGFNQFQNETLEVIPIDEGSQSRSIKTLIVDIDGVIADTSSGGSYAEASPLKYGIEQVNKLHDMGYEIKLFTARYGDREHGNSNNQYNRGYQELIEWLNKHNVKYTYAYMGKPAGVLYIDDKAARVRGDSEEGWAMVWEEEAKLNKKDKFGRTINEE